MSILLRQRRRSQVIVFWLCFPAIAFSQNNSWINQTSANWEDGGSWSLGIRPAAAQNVSITNAGYKAVGIFPQTAANFPSSLIVSNLTIDAPQNAFSTLLLNYFGTATPLRVLNSVEVDTNGLLLNLYSGLTIGAAGSGVLIVNGGQFAQEGGVTVGTNVATLIQNGSMNLTNATVSLGTLRVSNAIVVQNGGTFSNGGCTLEYGTCSLLAGSLTGGVFLASSSFLQSGGTNYGPISLGYYDFLTGPGDGTYVLTGGTLISTNINIGASSGVGFGTFSQSGGFVSAGEIICGGVNFNTYSPSGIYNLTNGTLMCGTWNMVNGGINQYGGRHVITNNLYLVGFDDPYGPFVSTGYTLYGGSLELSSFSANQFGYFQQNGGTNSVSGTAAMVNSGYTLNGGTLLTSNTTINTGWYVPPYQGVTRYVTTFRQSGGFHSVTNLLTILDTYNLSGGVVSAPRISDYARLEITAPGIITNNQVFDLGGTVFFGSSSTQQLGRLILSSNAVIDFNRTNATMTLANSSGVTWSNDATLIVTNWRGGGFDRLLFGNSATALSSTELSKIYFANPLGLLAGYYPAQILSTGEVVPSGTLVVGGWGVNANGIDDAPPGLGGVSAISCGSDFSLALKTNGAVVAWGGYSYYPWETQVPVDLTNAVAISAGSSSSLALRADGTVTGWGNSSAMNNMPGGLSNIVAVSTKSLVSLAVATNGRVIAWGDNYWGQTNVPSGLSNVVSVAAGNTFCLALKKDGTVVAWGDNSTGGTNVPAGLSNVVSIAAASHALALRADGSVFAWGGYDPADASVPSGLNGVTAVAAGGGFSVALKSDGHVITWGSYAAGTNLPAGLSNVVAIAAGDYNALVLLGTSWPQPFRLSRPQMLGGGLVGFGLAAPRGQRYEMQSSSNLVQWAFLQNAAGAGGTNGLVDTPGTLPPRRFYRAVRMP